MATFVRNRVLNQLVWSAEEERLRVQRRETLCELDGLLTQLEEVNLRGGPIPTRVLVALRRRGVVFRPRTSAAELIEAVFVVQERFMRQPDGLPRSDQAAVASNDLSRRLAS
jgi:hypothetical protein